MYLGKHGYHSLDNLIQRVNSTLNGDALKQWQQLQTESVQPRLIPAIPYLLGFDSLRDQHFWGEAILTISGLIAAATGIVVGALVVLAIITGPVGWAVFSVVSLAMAAVAAVAVIISIIEASKERDVSLPESLYVDRVKMVILRDCSNIYRTSVTPFASSLSHVLIASRISTDFKS